MNHPRPHAHATPDFRDHEALAWVDRRRRRLRRPRAHRRRTPDRRPRGRGHPAGTTSRTSASSCGAPRPCRLRGRRWCEHADAQRFRFDALGADTQLFGLPRTEHGDHPPRRARSTCRCRWGGAVSATTSTPTTAPAAASCSSGRAGAVATPVAADRDVRSATCPTIRRPAAGRTSRRPARSPSTPCSAASTSAPRWPPAPACSHVLRRTCGPGRAPAAAPGGYRGRGRPDRRRRPRPEPAASAERRRGGRHGARSPTATATSRPSRCTTVSGPAGEPDTAVQLVAGEGQQPLIVVRRSRCGCTCSRAPPWCSTGC